MKAVNIFCLSIILLMIACGNNRRPGFSDRELFAQKETSETSQQELDDFDAETYVSQPGIKYTESRAVDPKQPPIVIDIEQALNKGVENIPLSILGKSVKYINATIPKNMSVSDFVIRDDTLFISCRGEVTGQQFILPYTLDGKFMNFIWEVKPDGNNKKYHSDIEEEKLLPQESKIDNRQPSQPPPPPPSSMWSNRSVGDEVINSVDFDHTGKEIKYTVTRWQDRDHPEYRKHIISSISGAQRAFCPERFEDQNSGTYYSSSIGWIRVFRTLDIWFKKSPWCLITFSAQGDTLCRFSNYNQVTPANVTAGRMPERIITYTYNDHFTFRTDYADTIFRIMAHDKILPVYAINSGKYKLSATEGLRGEINNKVYIEKTRETQRFLFISINTPSREKQTLLFDKQKQTLRLNRNENFTNDIDLGPAFYPEKIMPDGKTMACRYTSSYFQNNPSTTISKLFPSMTKNSVVFMILQ